MPDKLSLQFYLEFEALVKEIFTHAGYGVQRSFGSPSQLSVTRPDLLLRDPDGNSVAIEIKLYRTNRAPLGQMLRAAEQLRTYMQAAGISRGIVVFSIDLELNDERLNKLFTGAISALGMQELLKLADKRVDLVQRLENLFRSSRIESLTSPTPAMKDFFEAVSKQEAEATGEIARSEEVTKETAVINGLIDDLRRCPKGKGNGPAYEAVGERAIKELFGEDLGVMKRQNRVAGGFHVVDLIASIKPKSEFWEALRSDFQSRYVIFEFKNYNEQIGQEQIFSTEKYLYRNALRSVAFIVARTGEDENAALARRGALREAGKLILTLCHTDLIKMLEMKRDADDYVNVLADKLDDMLTSLER